MVRSLIKVKASLVLLLGVLLVAPPASAYFSEPGYVPLRRSLPSAIDLMETSLYWMQDMAGVDDPRDPAAIIALMEDQAARFFDFSYMAYLVAGPEYTRLNVLERSHFQNRIRDRIFSMLATRMGMLDVRMPVFRPMIPRRTGTYTVVAGGEFYHRGGPHIRLLFHFYLSSKGWRIYDVTSNGVRAVAELRRHYFANRFDR
jgi:ABC-type transporter MlaC component